MNIFKILKKEDPRISFFRRATNMMIENQILSLKPGMIIGIDSPKIIGIEWRSGINTVGIIAVESKKGRWKAFIGGLPEKGGEDPDRDAVYIARLGCKLSEDEARVFFPHIPKNYEYDY